MNGGRDYKASVRFHLDPYILTDNPNSEGLDGVDGRGLEIRGPFFCAGLAMPLKLNAWTPKFGPCGCCRGCDDVQIQSPAAEADRFLSYQEEV